MSISTAIAAFWPWILQEINLQLFKAKTILICYAVIFSFSLRYHLGRCRSNLSIRGRNDEIGGGMEGSLWRIARISLFLIVGLRVRLKPARLVGILCCWGRMSFSRFIITINRSHLFCSACLHIPSLMTWSLISIFKWGFSKTRFHNQQQKRSIVWRKTS